MFPPSTLMIGHIINLINEVHLARGLIISLGGVNNYLPLDIPNG